MMPDNAGAFTPDGVFTLPGRDAGLLAGTSFCVKDLFDIAGLTTGAGNPTWAATHRPAERHAWAVERLLDAGAICIGKTITDELAYSMHGDNIHYGTPRNARAPGRVPGGSSSGSAAATAAGLCDFGLATDTGGSTRVPASYCGLYGIRPTHGRIPVEGLMALMPSLDVVSWLANSAEILERVGSVLFDQAGARPGALGLNRLLIAEDAFAEVDVGVAESLVPALAVLRSRATSWQTVRIAPDTCGLEDWRQTFRILSAPEAWAVHGDWIERHQPAFAPAIAERFAWARTVTASDAAAARSRRGAIARHLQDLLANDGILILPSAAGPAPLIGESGETVEIVRQRTQRLTCIAGLAGLPQISIPAGLIDGLPIGISLMAPAGSDEALLAIARHIGPELVCGFSLSSRIE